MLNDNCGAYGTRKKIRNTYKILVRKSQGG